MNFDEAMARCERLYGALSQGDEDEDDECLEDAQALKAVMQRATNNGLCTDCYENDGTILCGHMKQGFPCGCSCHNVAAGGGN